MFDPVAVIFDCGIAIFTLGIVVFDLDISIFGLGIAQLNIQSILLNELSRFEITPPNDLYYYLGYILRTLAESDYYRQIFFILIDIDVYW